MVQEVDLKFHSILQDHVHKGDPQVEVPGAFESSLADAYVKEWIL